MVSPFSHITVVSGIYGINAERQQYPLLFTKKMILNFIRHLFGSKQKSNNVALVLGGGGARGFAHIGAIEVLEEHGYHISAIAGTSMGALVGGFYAAGKLNELKDIALHLEKKEIISLLDLSLGLDHIASGDRLMALMDRIFGDERIEDLPIDFCCCASDLVSGSERVFRDGLLKTGIRASISIPCLLKPVEMDGHIYVDGSIHNTLPLDRVMRKPGDLLVAVNASGPDRKPFSPYCRKKDNDETSTRSILEKLPLPRISLSKNYMNMALRTCSISIQNSTQIALRLTPPDVYVDVPMDRYNLLDFHKGTEIYLYGREMMEKALRKEKSKNRKTKRP